MLLHTKGTCCHGTVNASPGAAVDDNDLVALAARLAPVLGALSDPNRLAILLAITQQPRSVKGLTETVGLSQTLISHHLKALRDAGLVVATAQGRSNIYSMCCGVLAEPARLLAALAGNTVPANDGSAAV
jgi:DNA-binding transcriptional ArsR family regulator